MDIPLGLILKACFHNLLECLNKLGMQLNCILYECIGVYV